MDFCVFRFPCTRLFLVSQQTTKYSLRDGDVDCYVFPFPVHRTGSSTLADYYEYISGWSNGFGCFRFPSTGLVLVSQQTTQCLLRYGAIERFAFSLLVNKICIDLQVCY